MALPVFHRQFRQENSIVTSDAVPLLSRVYYHPVDSKAVPAKNAVAANKHQLLSVPIKQPPLSSVPIKQPPLSSVPIKQPSLSSVPIKQPPLSSVPVKQSQLLSGPIKQPPLVLPRQLQSIDSRTADEERLQVSPESHSTNHDLAFSTRASWYGPGFHGRKTASGQIFNQYGLTAASRTLRLGSKVLVANP
jgi:rare lipoprotein A (peptidoglycan hydrolase)